MERASPHRLDEAGLEAEACEFSRKVRSALWGLEDCLEQFQRVPEGEEGSVKHVQLGYQIFRQGMELGELSKQWFMTVKPDQQVSPKQEALHHAERGRMALAESDWQSALSGLGLTCLSQPRCREAVSELGACAQQLAAWHLAQVGHLPNPEKFTRAVHDLVARHQSLQGVIERTPQNPEPRRLQNQVLSELVRVCESWSVDLGRFVQSGGGMLSRLLGRKAPPVRDAQTYPNGSLLSYGITVENNPSAIGAVVALKRTAKALMDNNASHIPKLEEEFQAKLRLERYKAEMQQHYDNIDQ